MLPQMFSGNVTSSKIGILYNKLPPKCLLLGNTTIKCMSKLWCFINGYHPAYVQYVWPPLGLKQPSKVCSICKTTFRYGATLMCCNEGQSPSVCWVWVTTLRSGAPLRAYMNGCQPGKSRDRLCGLRASCMRWFTWPVSDSWTPSSTPASFCCNRSNTRSASLFTLSWVAPAMNTEHTLMTKIICTYY